MSIQAVAWVLDQSRSRGYARLVLIALANHHNAGTGRCDPGQRLIAKEAGISPGSVGAQIRALVALGELEVSDEGGSHRSAKYRLPFMEPEERSAAERTDGASSRGVRAAGGRSTRGRAESTHGSGPRRTREPTTEPEPQDQSLSLTLSDVPREDPVVAIFEEWKRATSHPRAVLDDARAKAIAKALRHYPLEDCLDAVRGVVLFAHNMGATTGKKYDDVTLVLRDSAHVERFRDAWRNEGQASQLDRARAHPKAGATVAVLERMLSERSGGSESVQSPRGALPQPGR